MQRLLTITYLRVPDLVLFEHGLCALNRRATIFGGGHGQLVLNPGQLVLYVPIELEEQVPRLQGLLPQLQRIGQVIVSENIKGRQGFLH